MLSELGIVTDGPRSSVDEKQLRPRHQESSVARPSTAPHSGRPSGHRNASAGQQETILEENNSIGPAPKAGHQRFVLTDPVAFRYLEEDPSTTVLERKRDLQGYECYIVEQWTTSRTHPTSVITTYTGDTASKVVVGVLSVPTDEASWSPRLRVYFKALNQYHARRRDTPLGILMVTNLSSFPSSLTVIPVPDGDLRAHRSDFTVNENLKRLGCSGRVGLTLQPPSSATVSKFHQLYRTSEKNELYRSVIELVKLCQSALMLFNKLEIDYADGLLCDVTERAITDWWVEIGSEQYNIEPHDGILGPTTVSGLLGLLMGARNRLHACNAPVSKDPFDVESMKRGISHFQKQQRMPRTRRLDRRTLDRLHRATQKAAEHEGWSMPKVLKTTAAELSGKGGEMLVDAVGRRDRAGIAEIETCDLERFVELVYGERCKWLWRGKPMKRHRADTDGRGRVESGVGINKGLVFRHDDQGGFTWTARRNTMAEGAGMGEESQKELGDEMSTPMEADEQQRETKPGLVKRATGLPKQGLGKFKGVVGLKTHERNKLSVEEQSPTTPTTPIDENGPTKRRPLFRRAHSSPLSSPNSPKSPSTDGRLDVVSERQDRVVTDPGQASRTGDLKAPPPASVNPSRASLDIPPSYRSGRDEAPNQGDSDPPSTQPSVTVTADPSIAGSIYNGIDMNEKLPNGPETEKDIGRHLRRTLSFSHFISVQIEHRSDDAYPRHLSFSLAEDSVLTWPSVLVEEDYEARYNDAKAQLAEQELLATEAKSLRLALNALTTTTAPWTQSQLAILDTILKKVDSDITTLTSLHEPYLDRVSALQAHSEGVVRTERERMDEGIKEIETLAAKLEYEVNGLRGRIEDVEAGVQDYEKGVKTVEERVRELERDAERAEQGWLARCCVM
jgi:hypothetical protein